MSSDWQIKTLDDVCERITDGAHRSPKSVENGKPMASIKDLTEFGLNLETARLISNEDFSELVKQGCKPKIYDVLVAKDGNSALDTACILEEEIEAVLLSSIAILRADKKKINPHYLKYYFNNKENIAYLKSNFISGAAIPRIVLKDFRQAEIKVPSLEKQNKIVEILNSITYKIEKNNQINETLEAMAQTIFKSWFVDFDPVKAKVEAKAKGLDDDAINRAAMRVIASKTDAELDEMQAESPAEYANLQITASHFPDEFVESELGMIPKGWEVKSLDSIAEYHNGLALQKFRPREGEDYLPIVKIAELRTGKANHNEKAATNIRENSIIGDGDVVFSWSGTLLVDIWCGGKAALNQHLFKVISEQYPKWFYYFYTKHHLTEFQRIAADKAVTMGHIKRSHLKEALCSVPNTDLLENNLINSFLKQQVLNRLENKNLIELRDSLLPKLLSGEIEV